MAEFRDGPATSHFKPLPFKGGVSLDRVAEAGVSKQVSEAVAKAPAGDCVGWGIPFKVGKVVLLKDKPASIKFGPVGAKWLVFMHTADVVPLEANRQGFFPANRGPGRLGEHVADYVVLFEDASEVRVPIRRRHQIGMVQRWWGENCTEAVAHTKPHPVPAHHEQNMRSWGHSQTRVTAADAMPWTNWLFAWRNPRPQRRITGVRFEPVSGVVVISAVSSGDVSAMPLRWESRQKAVLRLPRGAEFDPTLDENGLLSQVRLDMGQVISASRRFVYPDGDWAKTHAGRLPTLSKNELLVEYTAHPEACFHVPGGKTAPVQKLGRKGGLLRSVRPAQQRVRIHVLEKGTKKPVAVRLHVHGEAGEYLPPEDRHRIPNPAWFEDYAADLPYRGLHYSAYISGETVVKMPQGKVFIEVFKGYEIRPIRKVVRVTKATEEIVLEIEKVLPWRERGWVTADTHVHFLSPVTALLEGEAEGVNVVNLLASQWGELMTNVGDFDGKTTWGSKEAGGSGEWLVRVGTENRQHIMGHISLLGYEGPMIAPMTTGGPDESAIGDPIEILLTEWGRQCKKQNGVVVLPHFPNPRLENAASIIEGAVDAVEMTSGVGGISPYSLSDWYRYLNCGYLVPAVGGTDKMSATVPVGANRTYARVGSDRRFTYDLWKEAVRSAETFVTCGPLMEFNVDGNRMGSRVKMAANGGTVDVVWEVASITMPMTKVELVVNGEVREGTSVKPLKAKGRWRVKIPHSSWLALLVRGRYAGQPEIVAAHSSPVMVEVKGSEFFAAADAVTILEQIEGAVAYLDTVGTRAETAAYKRMRLVLTSAYRRLHDRMHRNGHFHEHSHTTDHKEHH